MGPLPGKIARLEYMLKEMLDELEEIKKTARALEQENAILRNQLPADYCQQPVAQAKKTPPATASTLINLYNEGFHVCNVRFAQVREEECLFCLSLLRRQDSEVTGSGGD